MKSNNERKIEELVCGLLDVLSAEEVSSTLWDLQMQAMQSQTFEDLDGNQRMGQAFVLKTLMIFVAKVEKLGKPLNPNQVFENPVLTWN